MNRYVDKLNETPRHEFAMPLDHSDFYTWVSRQDAKKDQILTAINELSNTYKYASFRFSAAMDFVQNLHELELVGMGVENFAHFERCRDEYGNHIEEVLDELSEALRNCIGNNLIEDHLQPADAVPESSPRNILDRRSTNQ